MNSVLLVTNSAQMRKRIKKCLNDPYFKIHEASSAKAAIAQYRIEQSPVIVIDLFLPESTGIDLIKSFRQLSKETKLILISEMRTNSILERGFRFGADDILTVPFSDANLQSCVLQRLGIPILA